jgi:hypothetical protein
VEFAVWYWAEKGDYLEFDGHNVRLCDKDGFMKKSWEATSGVPGSGPEDQDIKNHGPIPEGKYIVDPKQIDYFDWYNPFDWWNFGTGDWGKSRVFIPATPETRAERLNKGIRRGEFFFHGGKKPGTIGCIDLGADEEDFFNTLEQYDRELELEVDYGL